MAEPRQTEPERQSLAALGRAAGTSKGRGGKRGHDSPAVIYEALLAPWRDLPVKILELGVEHGASLRMWRDYFPRAAVYGIDIKDKTRLSRSRMEVLVGHQADPALLDEVVARAGGLLDLVVDDASHRAPDQIASLLHLWPHLRPGGIYVVEDVHTSYREEYDMGWRLPGSTMEFLKDVIDDVHADSHGHPQVLEDLGELHVHHRTAVLRRHAPAGVEREPSLLEIAAAQQAEQRPGPLGALIARLGRRGA